LILPSVRNKVLRCKAESTRKAGCLFVDYNAADKCFNLTQRGFFWGSCSSLCFLARQPACFWNHVSITNLRKSQRAQAI